jgi:hypothetical protein
MVQGQMDKQLATVTKPNHLEAKLLACRWQALT